MDLRSVGGGKGYCRIGLWSLGIRWFGYVGAWKWIGGLVSETERALQRRNSCIAQGASPGLIIDIHLLSPQRGRHFPNEYKATNRNNTNQMRAPKVPLLRSSYFFCHVYPGFCSCLWLSHHPGLCKSVALKGSPIPM